jgi:hypothetical protein
MVTELDWRTHLGEHRPKQEATSGLYHRRAYTGAFSLFSEQPFDLFLIFHSLIISIGLRIEIPPGSTDR